MNKEDIGKVFTYAELLWSSFKREKGNEKEILQTRLWYDFLKPYELEVVYASMRELAKEDNFCSIAKISKGCNEIMHIVKDDGLDEDKIFNEINGAISVYNANENFERLSDVAKDVVVSPENLSVWAMSEVNDFNTVIASQIKRSIRDKIKYHEKCESVGFKKIVALTCENKKMLENK